MGTTKKRHLLSVIQKVLITCVMLVVISPFYISIVYALKNKNDLTINRLAWPTHPTLMNFQRVITENDQFLTGYKNRYPDYGAGSGPSDADHIHGSLCAGTIYDQDI